MIGNEEGVPSGAFSLIEILVTVGLLSFIVLGLLMMFNQTQRAFRGSMTQTDVLESGRLLTDMLARDLEQMTPSRGMTLVNGGSYFYTTNFFVETATLTPSMLQALPGSTEARTNYLQHFFFLSHNNQDWIGTGYEVVQDPGGGVGTLYRFSRTNPNRYGPINLSWLFLNTPYTNMSRIADGIVDLRVRAFATNGFPITLSNKVDYASFRLTDTTFDYYPVRNTVLTSPQQFAMYFVSNAVPAFVEIEVGILEPQILQRYRSLGDPVAKSNYLSNHVAQVHLFRQRVPIRNVDFSAYQ